MEIHEFDTPGINRFKLLDKVIVVTGGTGVLGSLYCRQLAEAGAQVVVADLDMSKCRALAAEITAQTGRRAEGISVDLSDEQSVIAWANAVFSIFGKVDVLINNAATKSPDFFAPLERFPLDDWNKVMAVNVTGMFLAMREIGAFL